MTADRTLTTHVGSLTRPHQVVVCWLKLKVLADGAAIASERLWGTA